MRLGWRSLVLVALLIADARALQGLFAQETAFSATLASGRGGGRAVPTEVVETRELAARLRRVDGRWRFSRLELSAQAAVD